ncbi:hypothetical protein [Methanocrinis sp.]|uniref:hypothetical protein n=1 Tax=Methanocrinis sp. TaxID=3101522 RepID=UPI003D1535F4
MEMRGVGTITRIWAALLVMLVVSGPAWAADNCEGYYLKNEQKLEQDVEGEGFAMVYQKVNTEALQLKNYMHGSGTMDTATLLSSNQSKGFVSNQDKYTLVYTGSEYPAKSAISFVEQNEMTYAPMAMAYGTGYYAENPIVYNSKLKERTEGKNYDGSACSKSYDEGVSMLHQIEYASAFVKDIGVELKNQEKSTNPSSKPQDGLSSTSMKIEEEVTEGSVHVGQLVTDADYGWKKPLIEIDENYAGSFKITKNMEVCTSCKGSKPKADWLSCCFGGYDGMDDEDKEWGEEEIFDCTCRDVAWGDSWNDTSKAQYCTSC